MIVKFFQHDIRQGLVKYIGRYILAVLISAIACGMLDQAGEYFRQWYGQNLSMWELSLIHISDPTRLLSISYAGFCLKKTTYTLFSCMLTISQVTRPTKPIG